MVLKMNYLKDCKTLMQDMKKKIVLFLAISLSAVLISSQMRTGHSFHQEEPGNIGIITTELVSQPTEPSAPGGVATASVPTFPVLRFPGSSSEQPRNRKTKEVGSKNYGRALHPLPARDSIPPNTLSKQEKAEGWRLLFDGKTTNGWHNYGKEGIGSAWKVIDGTLVLDDSNRQENERGYSYIPDGGDIVTDEEFENYELRLEWKISPCGNSGIMFNILETEEYRLPWLTGPEIQVLDNACHSDAKYDTHRAGCLYDLIPVSKETVKPAGEWNSVRIVFDEGHLENWLNGEKVVETQMWTDAWDKMVSKSKFKRMKAFAKAKRGRIGLQDHNDKVWFRNIKIKAL